MAHVGGESVRTISIVAALVTAALVCIEAQAPNHRDPSIPRSADGRPNLSAPAPRLNGKLDLSGVWQAEPRQSASLCASWVRVYRKSNPI